MIDFNLLSFNSKSYPATEPLVVRRGERVRIRIGNLSPTDHHPNHLHGLAFEVTATDGGEVKPSARHPETTVLVPVGTVRVVEFVAEENGDWPVHCHMTHHVMTQMGHGLPTMIGVETSALDPRLERLIPGAMFMGQRGMGEMDQMQMPVPENSTPMRGGRGPFGTIDMGGMFTILKVRDERSRETNEGWYVHPEGSVSGPTTPGQREKDGIEVERARVIDRP
jgi:hypothetical protein